MCTIIDLWYFDALPQYVGVRISDECIHHYRSNCADNFVSIFMSIISEVILQIDLLYYFYVTLIILKR